MMKMGIGGINEALTPHRYKLDPAYDNGGWHRLSILSSGMSMCNCYRLTIEPDFNGKLCFYGAFCDENGNLYNRDFNKKLVLTDKTITAIRDLKLDDIPDKPPKLSSPNVLDDGSFSFTLEYGDGTRMSKGCSEKIGSLMKILAEQILSEERD